MARYIDADALKLRIMRNWYTATEISDDIDAEPTADVVEKERYDRLLENATIMAEALDEYQVADEVERKNGKWIDAKPMSGRVGKVCSACGNEAYWDSDYGQQLFEWCPYCGAKMDGKETAY